jgi:hypothetical protein
MNYDSTTKFDDILASQINMDLWGLKLLFDRIGVFCWHFWHTCYLPDESLIWMSKCVLAYVKCHWSLTTTLFLQQPEMYPSDNKFPKLIVSVSASHAQHALCSRLFYPLAQGLALRETPRWIQCFGCVAHLHVTCAELKPDWKQTRTAPQLRDKVDYFVVDLQW